VNPGANYTIQLSTNQGTVAQPAPATLLHSTWVNTGETRSGTIDLGTEGLIDSRAYGFTNTVNFDFGIERLPESDNKLQTVNPTAGGTITAGSITTNVSGSDPEDGLLGNTGTIAITMLPNNATMFYNGIAVTLNQQISNFDPALLSFTSITLGTSSVVFDYAFLDAASKQDPTPATYTLTWTTPLPVSGLKAAVVVNGTLATISWSTLQEINTDYFEVERSLDNAVFKVTGNRVSAAGTSASANSYHQVDDISTLYQNKQLFYRVKLVDVDGRTSYSNVMSLPLNRPLGVTSWPNPFSSAVTVSISSNNSTRVNIRITDLLGKTIQATSRSVERGTSQVTLQNLEGLAAGTYLLEVTDLYNANRTVFKIVKGNN
jgi:hypothetical protein